MAVSLQGQEQGLLETCSAALNLEQLHRLRWSRALLCCSLHRCCTSAAFRSARWAVWVPSLSLPKHIWCRSCSKGCDLN